MARSCNIQDGGGGGGGGGGMLLVSLPTSLNEALKQVVLVMKATLLYYSLRVFDLADKPAP